MPIQRAGGVTDSEKYLARLAEGSFLNLWSYPNVFIDKRHSQKGDGKELCDLLVVCGDHIIIFSDKSIGWPEGDSETAWSRWYRRAIGKSLKQVRGAERWIRDYPDRIFLDHACTEKFPLQLPPLERRKVHSVIVALGAGKACREHFGDQHGSLVLAAIGGGVAPFTVGDIGEGGSFVHVFDDFTLDVAMRELDTITDFTGYLQAKERFVRSGELLVAVGEEELISYYITHTNSDDDHDFVKDDGSPFAGAVVSLDAGFFDKLKKNPQYLAKKKADQQSYVWDKLITVFTDSIIDGTVFSPEGLEFSLDEGELALRLMALEPRTRRRLLGGGVADALERVKKADRMTRAFLPAEGSNEEAYFFMALKVPDFDLEGGYEQYRQVRLRMLHWYALSILERNRSLRRIVGIGVDGPGGRGKGGSEDLILAEPPDFTGEFMAELGQARATFSIHQEGNYREYPVHVDEYPRRPNVGGTVSKADHPRLNRRARRALGRSRR